MKKHEKGQGLVEYALILVLVAIVVIAILLLLGPVIGGIFCGIVIDVTSIDPTATDLRVYEASMDMNDQYLDIDVKYFLNQRHGSCGDRVDDWDVGTDPSYGIVENHEDGIFTYWPNDVGSGTDDSFIYKVMFQGDNDFYDGAVTVIVGEQDPLVNETSIMRSEEQTIPELDEVEETILTLWEETADQEESLDEGIQHNLEAVVEGVEVLMDYADDVHNQVFYESLSQFLVAVEDGDLEEVEDIFTLLITDLDEIPIEVYVAMNLKMAPHLIEACTVVSSGTVPNEVIASALDAVEGLDDDHPRKTEALQSLQEAVDIIEARNFYIEQHSSFQSAGIGIIIELLEIAGEGELAEQLAADSAACGN